MSSKILLVEDSPEVQIVVRHALGRKYSLTTALTSAEATHVLDQDSFSLILLDIELPDEDGFKLCAKLKLDEKHKNTPIIFLTGRHHISDKIMGFSLGAEDYIVKPFDPLEFTARIDSKMRRAQDQQQFNETYIVEPFKINLPTQKAFLITDSGDQDLNLTQIEFKLLTLLTRKEDQVFSREQILNTLWGHNVSVSDRTIDTHIYTLRKKMGFASQFIQSVPRMGYRFSQNKSAA